MRKLTGTLEQNPMLQVLVLGGLALLLGLLLYVRVLGKSSGEPTPSQPAPAATATPPSDTGAAADSAAAGAPAPSEGVPEAPSAQATPSAPAPAEPSAGATAMTPGPGLPAEVSRAYRQNKVVVLSIHQRQGIPEHINLRAVRALQRTRGVPDDFAIFEFDVSRISRYARITRGVDVTRAPALVVVKPRALTPDGVPKAIVRYGYMGAAAAAQAVFDAAYSGPDRPYYPE